MANIRSLLVVFLSLTFLPVASPVFALCPRQDHVSQKETTQQTLAQNHEDHHHHHDHGESATHTHAQAQHSESAHRDSECCVQAKTGNALLLAGFELNPHRKILKRLFLQDDATPVTADLSLNSRFFLHARASPPGRVVFVPLYLQNMQFRI